MMTVSLWLWLWDTTCYSMTYCEEAVHQADRIPQVGPYTLHLVIAVTVVWPSIGFVLSRT